MAQSVELLLDERADAAIRRQWNLLAEAGLPSERRSEGGSEQGSERESQRHSEPGSRTEHHRPHLTLFAADAISPTAERVLPDLVAGLDIEIQIGALLLFGPRRGRVILVRQVTPSVDLLRLQAQVAVACRAAVDGQFGPGRWSPHVTLARRVPLDRVGDVLAALDRTADRPVPARVTQCRRWDGTAKAAWLL